MKATQLATLESKLWRLRMASAAGDEVAYNEIDSVKEEIRRIKDGESQDVGPFSGLTRHELRLTGTCETDWY